MELKYIAFPVEYKGQSRLIGSLEAFEALRILMGRKPAYADRLLCFDGESGTVEMVPVTV